ncbi:MAG: hypothetical protein QXZ53_04865 [Candidatus Bathyarchaeia archaeon]
MKLKFIIEAFKSLKRGKGVLICPKCGSLEVSASTPFDGAIFPYRYICLKCGYSSFLFLEASKEDLKRVAEALP